MRGGSGGGGIDEFCALGGGGTDDAVVTAVIPQIDAAIEALVHVLVTTVFTLFTVDDVVADMATGGREFGDWLPGVLAATK